MPRAARTLLIGCATVALAFVALAYTDAPVKTAHADETCCTASDSTRPRDIMVPRAANASYHPPLEGGAAPPPLDAIAQRQVAERLEAPPPDLLLANLRI